MIQIGNSPGKGRGVFARRDIRRGETIEEGPVVVFPASQMDTIDGTTLGDYYFHWGEDDEGGAILLGMCSLCNHSYTPNARFERKFANGTIEFVALRDIEAGEEITTNYHGEPDDPDPVWFDVVL
jgi:SET domain-containing protein